MLWSLGLVALGCIALLASPFLTRRQVTQHHLNASGIRLLRLNLLYTGVGTAPAGVLNLDDQGIAGWLLLVSVILVTSVISVLTNRLRPS